MQQTTNNSLMEEGIPLPRTISNTGALNLIRSHYNNTHCVLGVSLINFYAEMGAREVYYVQEVFDWLGY